MVFLILESLGSTELAFILVMALIFFGPRKLPQLSRSLGKNLASFRRASEDFKRTWEKEVDLEQQLDFARIETEAETEAAARNSILNDQEQLPAGPMVTAVDADLVVPRQPELSHPKPTSDTPTPPAEPLSKRDWL